MFCSECGADAGEEARFCPACGSSLEEPTPTSPGDASTPETPELAELRSLAAEVAEAERATPGEDGVLTHPLFVAADAAFSAGHRDVAEDILLDGFDGASEVGKVLLVCSTLRANDVEFRGHGIEGLEIRRVEFGGSRVSLDDLEMMLTVTGAGAVIPKPTRPGERVLVNLGAEIQLFGPNQDDERAAAIHARGFDSSGLHGQIEVFYGMRINRRLLWGFGHCLLTDQRALGLVFQRDRDSGGDTSAEREAMPDTFAAADDDGNPIGSVLAFSVARELFEDKELRVPLLTRRIPDINLIGDVDLSLSAWRVVDEGDRVVRPEKGQIAAAVEAFLPSTEAPDSGR